MTDLEYGPLADIVDATADRAAAEKRELLRRSALIAIAHADAGRFVDPHHLAWARAFVAANPALQGPLGTGEPT